MAFALQVLLEGVFPRQVRAGLKALAKDMRVPVVALSQLNRSCEERTPPRPQLRDLRESGSLEQDADVVLAVYRPDYYSREADDGRAEILVLKQRQGPPGSVAVRWYSGSATFGAVENETPERSEGE